MPAILKKEQCPCFRPIEMMRIAARFKRLMENVKVGEMRAIRLDLKRLLNERSIYYRNLNGERTLSPAQQEEITNLLKVYGYATSVTFDASQDSYRFCDE